MDKMEPVSQHRTQLYLPASLYQKVKEKVKREGISMAEFFRSLLELEFEKERKKEKKNEEKAWNELFKLAGIGASGLKDVSTDHDHYLTKDEAGSWQG